MSPTVQSGHEEGRTHRQYPTLGKSNEVAGAISLGLVSFFSFLVICTGPSSASVVDYALQGRKAQEFTFQEACSAYGYKNRPLISKLPADRLDCMGGEVDLLAFCRKRVPNAEQFAHVTIDESSMKVICEQAKRVSLKVACDEKLLEQDYCFDAKGGCQKLGHRFANQLPLQYSGLTDGAPKKLNCEFATQVWLDLPLLKPMM